MLARKGGVRKITGPVSVWIHAVYKKPTGREVGLKYTRPDVDNIAKAILDGLQGIAYKDDGQVAFLEVGKRWSVDDTPGVHVRLKGDRELDKTCD